MMLSLNSDPGYPQACTILGQNMDQPPANHNSLPLELWEEIVLWLPPNEIPSMRFVISLQPPVWGPPLTDIYSSDKPRFPRAHRQLTYDQVPSGRLLGWARREGYSQPIDYSGSSAETRCILFSVGEIRSRGADSPPLTASSQASEGIRRQRFSHLHRGRRRRQRRHPLRTPSVSGDGNTT